MNCSTVLALVSASLTKKHFVHSAIFENDF